MLQLRRVVFVRRQAKSSICQSAAHARVPRAKQNTCIYICIYIHIYRILFRRARVHAFSAYCLCFTADFRELQNFT